MATNKDFKAILETVQRTKKTVITTPSVPTNYFNYSRRSWKVVEAVNKMLEEYDVDCEPEYSSAWYYGSIELRPKPKISAGEKRGHDDTFDPTPRLRSLKAANINLPAESGAKQGLVSVQKDTPLEIAITLMMLHDYSQLPILSSPRDVEGIVSWRSIGRALAMGTKCERVIDCKEEVSVLSIDESLFTAVKTVMENEVVLVRQKDKVISGIVTIADIGEQFISMAEPFLLIEQIERNIRKLLDEKFTSEEIRSVLPSDGKDKQVSTLADLSFGQLVRLVEDPKRFDKLKLKVDRSLLVKQLEQVRRIRNEVMHFEPEGILPEDLSFLRQTLGFIQFIVQSKLH